MLTVPPPLRLRYWDDADLWAADLRAFIAYMKEHVGFAFGYVRTHPTGDDLTTWHPHANILFVQHESREKGFRGKLPLDDLRAAWAAVLGWDGEVNLHAQYFDVSTPAGWRKLCHAVRYIERPFPGWMWAGAWGRWYGSYPRGDFGIYTDGKCPCCGERFELRMLDWDVDDTARRLAEAACWAGRSPPTYRLT